MAPNGPNVRTDHGILVGMVGRGGLEPPTLRLSGVRSNHLSYRPPSVPAGRMGRGRREPAQANSPNRIGGSRYLQ